MSCVHRVECLERLCSCASDRWGDGQLHHYVEEQNCGTGVCPHYNIPNQTSRGLGDTLHKFTHALGIDWVVQKFFPGDCGCGKRKQAFNELVPYKDQE